jgi:hypothetical protein
VPRPAVRGPIGEAGLWGHALFDSWFSLEEIGYRDDEFFVSGRARRLGAPNETAPYTTRIIVTRPKRSADFNGTVVLEWVNVTAQFENPVDILEAHEMLFREGYAFVHVSAQQAGLCCTPLTPKVWDPVRYADLSHPGDDYAEDIFSQVALAMRVRRGADPLGGLRARRVLAVGQSQSAIRLATYVRSVQPRDRVIDGFLIHGGGSKVFQTPPLVPVVHLLSDLEASPEMPNTKRNYRLWEIAGAAHSDFWIGYHQEFGQGPRALLHAPRRPASDERALHETAGNYGEEVHPLQGVCIAAGSLFPMRYAVSAAIHALDRWAGGGEAPRSGPRFRFEAGALARDANGNALGGIRLPPIAVPVATYASTTCGLGGITIPFTPVQLRMLYPTHESYVARMRKATEASVRAGFLLPEDARDLMARASRAPIPSKAA